MNLKAYFTETNGTGIFSTADSNGLVNSAVYATPHVTGIDTVQFIMRDRLSRKNLLENKNGCYLFMEEGSKGKGIRLYLQMTGEEQDQEKINALSRRPGGDKDATDRYLVSFAITKALNLVGGEELSLEA